MKKEKEMEKEKETLCNEVYVVWIRIIGPVMKGLTTYTDFEKINASFALEKVFRKSFLSNKVFLEEVGIRVYNMMMQAHMNMQRKILR
jgi:hypothetical protein